MWHSLCAVLRKPKDRRYLNGEALREAKAMALAAVGLAAGLSISLLMSGDRFRAMGWDASAPSAVAFPAPRSIAQRRGARAGPLCHPSLRQWHGMSGCTALTGPAHGCTRALWARIRLRIHQREWAVRAQSNRHRRQGAARTGRVCGEDEEAARQALLRQGRDRLGVGAGVADCPEGGVEGDGARLDQGRQGDQGQRKICSRHTRPQEWLTC